MSRRTINDVRKLDALCDLINTDKLGKPDSYAHGDPMPSYSDPDYAAKRAVYRLGVSVIQSPGDRYGTRYTLRDGVTYCGARAASDALMHQLWAGDDAAHWNLNDYNDGVYLSLFDVLDGSAVPVAPVRVNS